MSLTVLLTLLCATACSVAYTHPPYTEPPFTYPPFTYPPYTYPPYTDFPHAKAAAPHPKGTKTATLEYGPYFFDLVFIIDESESVGGGNTGGENWQQIKTALQYATDCLNISQYETRMAWVGFSSQAITDWNQIQLLGNSYSSGQTSAAIDDLMYHPGGSNAVSAFQFTRDVLLTAANGARKDPSYAEELIILISDGNYKTWDVPVSASSVAQQLRYGNTSIYAVAVTEDYVDQDNLLAITGYKDHVYTVSHYSLVKYAIQEILTNAIKTFGKPPPAVKSTKFAATASKLTRMSRGG